MIPGAPLCFRSAANLARRADKTTNTYLICCLRFEKSGAGRKTIQTHDGRSRTKELRLAEMKLYPARPITRSGVIAVFDATLSKAD